MRIKATKAVLASMASAIIGLGPVLADVTLNGAGATFPYPIYSKWFDEYNKIHPDVKINYQSIGSGGGIRQFTAKTVDFGASDAPMTDKEESAVNGKVLHIPTVLGAVVITWNVPGVEQLNLSSDAIAKIYLGDIKSWNDNVLKNLNPGVTLPDMPITVVHRSDGSGTTYCFTDYLGKTNADWKKRVGTGKAVSWPIGLGGKGNEGVVGLVKQTQGAIGYTELIYAQNNNLPTAAVKNKAGILIKASAGTVSSAAASAKMSPDFKASIVNAPGKDAYPISTFTWLLVYAKNSGQNGKVLRDFLNWAVTDGQKMAPALGYAPLPENVKTKVLEAIKTIS